MKKLSILLLILVIGCNDPQKEKLGELSNQTSVILKETGKDSSLEAYYLFSGIREYAEKYEGLESNQQAFKLFRTVRDRLKIDKTKYKKLDDFIESKLFEAGLDTPKKFDEESRKKFVELFKQFELGALDACR